MGVPDWASGADKEREREEIAEDQRQRALDAGEEPNPVNIGREWSSVKEVAQRHRCSEKTIRKHRKSGALRAHAINPAAPEKQRRYRIHRDDELAWIKSKMADVRKPRTTQNAAATRSFKDRVK